jgi:hypothetical protein
MAQTDAFCPPQRLRHRVCQRNRARLEPRSAWANRRAKGRAKAGKPRGANGCLFPAATTAAPGLPAEPCPLGTPECLSKPPDQGPGQSRKTAWRKRIGCRTPTKTARPRPPSDRKASQPRQGKNREGTGRKRMPFARRNGHGIGSAEPRPLGTPAGLEQTGALRARPKAETAWRKRIGSRTGQSSLAPGGPKGQNLRHGPIPRKAKRQPCQTGRDNCGPKLTGGPASPARPCSFLDAPNA